MTIDVNDMIRRHEGLRLHPYKDTAGVLTIGYGRNLEEIGISKLEADYLLVNDVTRARSDLLSVLPQASGYGERRFAALTDMMFNLGATRFQRFKKMLEALRAGEFVWAAREMRESAWADQVGYRAEELARMVEEG